VDPSTKLASPSQSDQRAARWDVGAAANQLRVLERRVHKVTIPNQSSVPKALLGFDEAERMKPSACYDRVMDAIEKLTKFTLLTRGRNA